MLVKDHMTGDNNVICGEVKATIAFVVIEKAKKDTLRRARCEFMGHGGGKIRVTTTLKDTEVIMWVVYQKELDGECGFEGFWWGED